MTRMSRLFTKLALFSTLIAVARAEAYTSDGTRIIAGYEPRIWLSVIGITLYALSGGLHWIHWFRNKHNRYMLTLAIGMTCMVLGFCLRIAYNTALDSIGMYAIMTLFILLSPCAFLATNYMLLTRLARGLNAESALFIRASLVVKIFVWCDVLTFLLQGAGGGLSSQPTSADLGHKITLVGLALQLVSYGLFCILLVFFGLRAPHLFPQIRHTRREHSRDTYNPFDTSPLYNWKHLWYILLVTSVGIIIRSAFRLAEYTQGYDGYLPTHEAYFYLLDALPLWIAMSLYSLWWPHRYIEGSQEIGGHVNSRRLQGQQRPRSTSSEIMESPVSTTEFKMHPPPPHPHPPSSSLSANNYSYGRDYA